jgi:hypothetical protein
MTRTLPKGMDFLLAIRKGGMKPSRCVRVYLDENRPRPAIFSDLPLAFEVCVKPGDDIARLDFRGLVGLSVFVVAQSLTNRLRALLKSIVHAKPEFLCGSVADQPVMFGWHPKRGWEFDRIGRNA